MTKVNKRAVFRPFFVVKNVVKYDIMLDFQNISLDLKPTIDKYYYLYGEGSCQHSFAASFCLQSKYLDKFCVKDDVLYINREGLSDEKYKTYLFPMCDRDDRLKIKSAIDNIIEDARNDNKKVKFETITEKCKDIVNELYPNNFIIEDCRDLYEYIYEAQTLMDLPGSTFLSKRKNINKFFREYADRLTIRTIEERDIPSAKELHVKWLNVDEERLKDKQLSLEIEALHLALDNFEALKLRGIVVYIDDVLAGFAFGSKVSEDYFDGMIEKGDINFKEIYKVLNKELIRLCCTMDTKYVNFEEDLGVEGLRKSKLMYNPIYLLKKYKVMEA